MTTFYIVAGIGWLVTCAFSYALGHREGVDDGRREYADYCRRRCAK